MKYRVGLAIVLFLFAAAKGAPAMEDACFCQRLADDKKALAAEILKEQHKYDCCDRTIAECMVEDRRCRLSIRLANQVCRMADKGATKSQIVRALEKRAFSMTPSARKAELNMKTAEFAGDQNAPVVVTLYLCVRCPFCAKMIPWLYKEVTKGKLKGKARLAMKLFPIKGHVGSTESGLTAMAAQKQGKLFSFMLYAYKHFDAFSVDKMPAWAKAAGLDMEAYRGSLADAATRKDLVESKKEGILNKVDATPTIFINGRLYRGKMDPDTFCDVLEEEHDRVTGNERQ